MVPITHPLRLGRRFLSTRPLIDFQKATIYRVGQNEPILKEVTWQVKEGENWVITGRGGAGKTTLAEASACKQHVTLTGQHRTQPPLAIQYPFLRESNDLATSRHSRLPADNIKLVSFRENSSMFSDPHDDITLRSYLGLTATQQTKPGQPDIPSLLNLAPLLDLSFMKLSNGQTRRARIGRALYKGYPFVILDEPMMGLDKGTRTKLGGILGNVVQTTSTHVLLVLRLQDEIPDFVTHVLELTDHGTVAWKGEKHDWLAQRKHTASGVVEDKTTLRVREWSRKAAPIPIQDALLSSLSTNDMDVRSRGSPIIDLKDIKVSYGGKPILQGLDWRVRGGERWALFGANGSGKTTLLSLLTGDHPQAYANQIELFGRPRGSGETIWDIKRKVGLISPELHLYFNPNLTPLQAAASGFRDVVVAPGKVTQEERKRIEEVMRGIGLDVDRILDGEDSSDSRVNKARRRFGDLSMAEQRLVLLVRSLVKSPPLLIWDEPYQGLDPPTIAQCNAYLSNALRPDQSLIFVTHHEEEVPEVIDRRLILENGKGVVEAVL